MYVCTYCSTYLIKHFLGNDSATDSAVLIIILIIIVVMILLCCCSFCILFCCCCARKEWHYPNESMYRFYTCMYVINSHIRTYNDIHMHLLYVRT